MASPTHVRFRPGGALAASVVTLLSLGIVLELVYLAALWPTHEVLTRVLAGEFVDDAELFRADLILGLAALPMLFVYLATVVVFCCWIFRAHKNLTALGTEGLKYSPGWAVGYYFIPFVNLFRPPQVMSEIWRASGPEHRAGGPGAWQETRATNLIGNWWGAWLLANIIGNISMRVANQGTAESVLMSCKVDLAGGAMSIVAAACLIMLVRQVSDRQQRTAATVHAAPGTPSGLAPVPAPHGMHTMPAQPAHPMHPAPQAPPVAAESNPYDLPLDDSRVA